MQTSHWSSLALFVVLLAPAIEAQTPEATVPPAATVAPRRTLNWSGYDALGFAGLGTGVGMLAGGAGGAGFVVGGVIGALVGGMIGGGVGSGAEKLARQGQPVGDGQRAMAIFGVVLAGGAPECCSGGYTSAGMSANWAAAS
jgi:hypothetical protein